MAVPDDDAAGVVGDGLAGRGDEERPEQDGVALAGGVVDEALGPGGVEDSAVAGGGGVDVVSDRVRRRGHDPVAGRDRRVDVGIGGDGGGDRGPQVVGGGLLLGCGGGVALGVGGERLVVPAVAVAGEGVALPAARLQEASTPASRRRGRGRGRGLRRWLRRPWSCSPWAGACRGAGRRIVVAARRRAPRRRRRSRPRPRRLGPPGPGGRAAAGAGEPGGSVETVLSRP